ncbi:MAG: MaoC/PaaZ C-terminal domain-containing protein [Bacillota bacterium]|nr:MaoC/PaaZ C-terminal domain-containing protein [Bacillota bacterium]
MNLVPGAEITWQCTVTRDMIARYAQASGDHNPIHLDDEAARRAGLPGVVAHGLWTLGALGDGLLRWVGDPARVVELFGRFSQPVRPGDTLLFTLRVTGQETRPELPLPLWKVEGEVKNQAGETVLAKAGALLRGEAL